MLKLIVTSRGALPRSMVWRRKEIELGILDPTSARDVFRLSDIPEQPFLSSPP